MTAAQLSFDDPCARLTDPETSRAAARMIAPRVGTDRARVLQAMYTAKLAAHDTITAALIDPGRDYNDRQHAIRERDFVRADIVNLVHQYIDELDG